MKVNEMWLIDREDSSVEIDELLSEAFYRIEYAVGKGPEEDSIAPEVGRVLKLCYSKMDDLNMEDRHVFTVVARVGNVLKTKKMMYCVDFSILEV